MDPNAQLSFQVLRRFPLVVRTLCKPIAVDVFDSKDDKEALAKLLVYQEALMALRNAIEARQGNGEVQFVGLDKQ